jgi:phospholipid/cholesterol/gamma-HCH transport system ATP-binding protein
VIALENVEYQVGERRILDGVDLSVGAGKIVGVMGQSGSGKTTLLRLVVGLVRPTAGRILIDGTDITALSERELNQVRRQMAFVFQYSALFDSLTVADNVAFALREHNLLPPEQIPAAVAERLRSVGLEGVENMMPAELSGGMQKRVATARALAMEPSIMLYDEPTAGLDSVAATSVEDLIVDLRERLGVTSLVVSHDAVSLARIADEIAVLEAGRIQFRGTPDEVRATTSPVVRKFVAGRLAPAGTGG